MKLQLYWPIKPHIVTQDFGESLACAENNALPISQRKIVSKNYDTCPAGYVELYPLLGMKGHTGIDIRAYSGQPLYHCGPDSVVQEMQTEPERGLGLGLVTKESFDFEGDIYQAKIRYWHLKSFNVKLGDVVHLGDLIGLCDNTGLSSGDHLHFELKPVIMKNGVTQNFFQNNGYFGSVNPAPYFVSEYAMIKEQLDKDIGYFNFDIKYGQSSEEVKRLQMVLSKLGYFTYPEITGYYGEFTRKAVFQFQMDRVKLTSWEYFITRGKIVGPKTRVEINSIINNNKKYEKKHI